MEMKMKMNCHLLTTALLTRGRGKNVNENDDGKSGQVETLTGELLRLGRDGRHQVSNGGWLG